jgi:hypothetical protein
MDASRRLGMVDRWWSTIGCSCAVVDDVLSVISRQEPVTTSECSNDTQTLITTTPGISS